MQASGRGGVLQNLVEAEAHKIAHTFAGGFEHSIEDCGVGGISNEIEVVGLIRAHEEDHAGFGVHGS